MAIVASLHDCTTLLQHRIDALRELVPPQQRIIISLAGAPGSGKSTIATKLLSQLGLAGVTDVAVMPMDGFHHPKAVLASFDDAATAFRRRGAPYTFDGHAFIEAVRLLRTVPVTHHDDSKTEIRMPSFDHAVQDPVLNDICIPSTVRVLIIEGNYTMFDQPPWGEMTSLASERWFVHVSRSVAKLRLAKRHVAAGIETAFKGAERRAEENDLPNGDLIRAHLLKPDVIIEG